MRFAQKLGGNAQIHVFVGSKVTPGMHCVFSRLQRHSEEVFGQAGLFLNVASNGVVRRLANLLIPILLDVPSAHVSNLLLWYALLISLPKNI